MMIPSKFVVGGQINSSTLYSPLPPTLSSRLPPPPVDPSSHRFAPSFIKGQLLLNSTSNSLQSSPSMFSDLDLSSIQSIYQFKVLGKSFPLDNLPTPSSVKEKRSLKSKSHSLKKTMTSREKKDLGIKKLPPTLHSWSLFLPLHDLWSGYMEEVLMDWIQNGKPNPKSPGILAKLLKADYHGCIMTGAVNLKLFRAPSKAHLKLFGI